MRKFLGVVIAALTACLVLASAPSQASPRDDNPTAALTPARPSNADPGGTYVALTPARVYDSRTKLRRPLKAGEAIRIRMPGAGGVSASLADVQAVAINLTTTGPTRGGYLAAYPSGSSGAGISTLTYAAGDTRAVLATVPVGPDGSIVIRNSGGAGAGSAHAIVDVEGYYLTAAAPYPPSASSEFAPADPSRLFDTRNDGRAFQPSRSYEIGVDVDDAFHVDGLVINLTAVGPTAPGYLTAYDNYENKPPATSSLNFTQGRTTTNQVIVPITYHYDSSDGYVAFAIFAGTSKPVNVLADVVGVYARDQDYGQRFVPLEAPTRVIDSRVGTGDITTFGPGQTQYPTVPGVTDPNGYTTAVVGTLTAVRPTAPTFVTAWGGDTDRPTVSSLNPLAGRTVSNQAIIPLGYVDAFALYNQAGRTDVIYDVVGRFDVPTGAGQGRTAGSASPATRLRKGPTAGRTPRLTSIGSSTLW